VGLPSWQEMNLPPISEFMKPVFDPQAMQLPNLQVGARCVLARRGRVGGRCVRAPNTAHPSPAPCLKHTRHTRATRHPPRHHRT
jgi:hypothetical protein